MFAKLSTLALALLPMASALTIVSSNAGWTPGATVTIQWNAATTDPSSFSIELVNPSFNKQYAIANNVPTANGQITLLLPQVLPGDGYSISFVANNNDQTVYTSSPSFSIGAASSVSATTPSTSSASVSTASLPVSSPSVTIPPLSTTPVSSVPPLTTPGTSSSASATPSTFNTGGAAAPFKFVGAAPVAALVLSAIVGATMVF